MKPLKAIVLGSGYAGQGHAQALRACGVEVVAMVSRNRDVVRRAADAMSIPEAGTNWSEALDRHTPDVVAIGTPGGVHLDPILEAVSRGCHVYCDKPLAPTAAEAGRIYHAAEAAGVKHAYAASFCYQPAVLHAAALVEEGAIGDPLECECISHYDLNPLIPFGWSHRLTMGGGRLNNNFTHKLAIVQTITGARPVEVMGECRNDLGRVPVTEPSHDFRERETLAPESAESHQGDWREVDSDWSYTVGVRLRRSNGPVVSAWFRHGGLQPRFGDDYVAVYGRDGAIYIPQAYAQGNVHIKHRNTAWEELDMPRAILDRLPDVENHSQRNWTALMQDFIRDIRGEDSRPYLTFRDGWVFQQVIDSVRRSAGWTAIELG